jgi:hypothetical protein
MRPNWGFSIGASSGSENAPFLERFEIAELDDDFLHRFVAVICFFSPLVRSSRSLSAPRAARSHCEFSVLLRAVPRNCLIGSLAE